MFAEDQEGGRRPISLVTDQYGLIPPARNGYTFVGWAEAPGGEPVIRPTPKTMYDGQYRETVTFDSCLTEEDLAPYVERDEVILYAVWEKNAG